MLSLVWLVLAIVATVRGARWKPWIAVALGLSINLLVGFGLGLLGYRVYETQDFILILGIAVESVLVLITGFYAIRPKPSSF